MTQQYLPETPTPRIGKPSVFARLQKRLEKLFTSLMSSYKKDRGLNPGKGDMPYLDHSYGYDMGGMVGTIRIENTDNPDAWLEIASHDLRRFPMAVEMR